MQQKRMEERGKKKTLDEKVAGFVGPWGWPILMRDYGKHNFPTPELRVGELDDRQPLSAVGPCLRNIARNNFGNFLVVDIYT